MRAQVAEYIEETPWAILPSRLRQWVAALASEEPDEQIRARFDQGQRQAAPSGQGVGVVQIIGPISHRTTMMEAMFGIGTSANSIGAQVMALVADPNVKAIVLDVDSPGGSVLGMTELVQTILRAREVKPIIAHANMMMASAAYWIGSSASEVVAAPSAVVGSIGIVTTHTDVSKAMEKEGIKQTIITSGQYKAEADPGQPLSEEARARLQELSDHYYASFVGDVARGRGVPVASVRTNYGQGRLLTAREGLAAGMVDRIATMDETLGRVLTGKRGQAIRALEEPLPIVAELPDAREGLDRRQGRERRLALARLR